MECKIYQKIGNGALVLFYGEDYYRGISLLGGVMQVGYYSMRWDKNEYKLYNGEFELVVDNNNIIFDNKNNILYIKYRNYRESVVFTKVKLTEGKVNAYLVSCKDLTFEDSIGKKVILKNK